MAADIAFHPASTPFSLFGKLAAVGQKTLLWFLSDFIVLSVWLMEAIHKNIFPSNIVQKRLNL